MHKTAIQTSIENYINAYNSFDVAGMMALLHPEIAFENISNGEVTLSIKGIANFKQQAEEATRYFTTREQKITQLTITDHTAEALIAYTAILAHDLPNGMKAGDKLELEGRSVFTFRDGKIIRLQDYS